MDEKGIAIVVFSKDSKFRAAVTSELQAAGYTVGQVGDIKAMRTKLEPGIAGGVILDDPDKAAMDCVLTFRDDDGLPQIVVVTSTKAPATVDQAADVVLRRPCTTVDLRAAVEELLP